MRLIDEKILLITPKCELNGCGPKKFGWMVPDRWWLVDFEMACSIHDAHYYWIKRNYKASGNSSELEKISARFESVDMYDALMCLLFDQRKYADEVFYHNLVLLNKEKSPSWIGMQARKPIIWTYYKAVRAFGHNFLK